MIDYNVVYFVVGILLIGVVIGASLVRYGISLGSRMYFNAKNELPFGTTQIPTEQDTTGE